MEEEEVGFRVGQRVHSAGNPHRTGTVRYAGPIEGYSGSWVGVDWDDDGDGKHDGSVKGIRYFNAKAEKSASFVRPKNLSSGISFMEAFHLRYRGNSTKEEEDEMYVLSSSKKRVLVQLVGKNKVEERLNHLEELLSVSVANLGVSTIGDPDEIAALVPNLKELDLTGNLLSRWQDINSICKALPALEVLELTNNMMECDLTDLVLLKNIHVLVLNNCGITWEQIEKIIHSLPTLKELHLMGNKLRTITFAPSAPLRSTAQGFDSLRILNLEDNCISMWDEIVNLSHLHSLEELHLNKNNLKNIFYPAANYPVANHGSLESECSLPFENLKCLLLGCNEIEDLASVDSLNFFPSLMDIRLSENPIADPAKGGVPRFVLIARLANAKVLNGSEVSPRERKESEMRYVRLVMAKLQTDLVMAKLQTDNPEEIKKLHPRFAELKSLHGIADEKPSTGPAGPQKMGYGLLNVTLKCVGVSMGEKLALTKKLPPTTTVGKLKFLCESFFKLKGIKLKLFVQEEGSPLPQFLDDDTTPLVDIGVGTGGTTILVDEES